MKISGFLKKATAYSLAVLLALVPMLVITPVNAEAATTYKLIFPVNNGVQIGYYYGYTAAYGSDHGGLDIHDKKNNDTIYAAAAGKVIATANSCPHVNYGGKCAHWTTYGNYIQIQDSNGIRYYYGHLKQNSLKVSVGDTVKAGQAIATMGSSGYSTGKHLHFEMRQSNGTTKINVNPTSKGGSCTYTDGPYYGGTTPDTTKAIYDGAAYYISPKCASSCYIGVSGNGTANKSNVCLVAKSAASSLWIAHKYNGYWYFTNKNSGKVLDIYGDSASSGANLQIYSLNKGDTQLFSMKGNNGYYLMTAKGKNVSVDTYGDSGWKVGTNMWVYTTNNGNSQLFKFTPVELVNKSSVSATEVNAGDTITAKGAATGGEGSYTYAYYYRPVDQTGWTTVGTKYGTQTSVNINLTNPGQYYIDVHVKDQAGTDTTKRHTVTVKENFANKSSVSSTEVTAGTQVTVNGAASGGKTPYTFTYSVKRESAASWTVKAENTTNTSVAIKPTQAEPYLVKVDAKDANGTVKTVEFKINVTAALKNTSQVSSQSAKVGDNVFVLGSAEGGKAPYTYSYYVKTESAANWKAKAENTDNAYITIKPTQAVPYLVKVDVKDSAGTVKSKEIKINVTKAASELVNNASVSSSSITLGETVTVNGAAAGGEGSYTYSYYVKRASAANWTKKAENTAQTSVTLKPSGAEPYLVKVDVKDSAGNVKSKEITIEVTK